MKPTRPDYDPQLPSIRPRSHRAQLWLGILVSNLVGFGATGLMFLLNTGFDWNRLGQIGTWTQSILTYSNFLLIPFGMGVCAAYFWRDLKLEGGQFIKTILLNFLVTLLGAIAIFREGAICLVMAGPLLLVIIGAGSWYGVTFWKKYPFLGVSVVPVLLVLMVADVVTPKTFHSRVTAQFHSRATPAALWRYAASYPANPHPPNWWLWKMGMPAPVSLRGQTRVGGRRDCQMTGDIWVGSKVTAIVPNRQIDFVIDRQPAHPEALNHFISERGRIEFTPDGKGGTRLRATSWYQLQVYPGAYFNLFMAPVFHRLHRRVFEHMDELALKDS